MALSDEQIRELAEDGLFFRSIYEITREIEAEVRKQNNELILQLVEAMEGVKALNMGGELALWTAEFDRLLSAITAAKNQLNNSQL